MRLALQAQEQGAIDRTPVIGAPEILSDGRAESAGQFDPSVVTAADVHAVRGGVLARRVGRSGNRSQIVRSAWHLGA